VARAILLAEKDQKLSTAKRKELAEHYADQAINLLRQAIARGYKDVAHMKGDEDLGPLHSRADFQKLVQELEQMSPSAY
jgi:hypothetical protein